MIKSSNIYKWKYSVFNDKTMPAGVSAIQFIQAFSTFSYAIIYSSLILYIVKQLGLPQVMANGVMGAFLALNYVLHLLGGMLGGNYISNRKLFLITTVLQTIGIALLAVSTLQYLYLALSLFLVGCGINTTCLNTLLTERFASHDDEKRDKAFFINYSAMNAGFFLGYLIGGFFDASSQYQNLFVIGTIFNVLTLFTTLRAWPHLKENNSICKKNEKGKKAIVYLSLLSLLPFLIACLQNANLSNHFVMGASTATFIFILFISLKQSESDKQKLHAFLILTITSIIFWMIYFTGPMGITLFIKNNVDREIGSFTIATQWLSDINSIVIILGAPFVSRIINKLRAKGYRITVTMQFICSFIILSASFFCLSLGTLCSNSFGYCHIMWLVLHIVLQGLGELLIGPVGYSMIGKIAPNHMKNFLMGAWMMVSGVSASLSHYFSNMMVQSESIDPIITNPDYYRVFNQLGMWALLGAGVLALLSKLITSQINQRERVAAIS